MSAKKLRNRPLDFFLVISLVLFAFISFVMEIFTTFGVDLKTAADPFGKLWYFYASSWDPLFLNPPLYLRVMSGIDAFIFGPLYLVAAYGLARAREWVRIPGLIMVSAVVYSTLVYFGVEFIGETARANLMMVVLINIPYTIVPLLLGFRLRRTPLFSSKI